MEKTCKVCGITKPCTKGQTKASGFFGLICWDCYIVQDRVRCLEKQRAYYATAIGRAAQQAASRLAMAKARAIPERQLKMNQATKAWQKKYPEKATANSVKRHAAKLQRVPSWANLNIIKQVYKTAKDRGLVVDHIFPLCGATVSGLHVANNLQLLTAFENGSKGTKLPSLPETWA